MANGNLNLSDQALTSSLLDNNCGKFQEYIQGFNFQANTVTVFLFKLQSQAKAVYNNIVLIVLHRLLIALSAEVSKSFLLFNVF